MFATECGECGRRVEVVAPWMLVECVCGAFLRVDIPPFEESTSSPGVEIDHYRVLGVLPSASTEEIRAAFRRRAKEAHPDTGGDASEFRLVQSAWAVLRDPDSRRAYDRAFADSNSARELNAVPDVIGVEAESAVSLLLSANFTVRVVVLRVRRGSALAHRVVGQVPPPGSRCPYGTAVGIFVAVPEQSVVWARVAAFATAVASGVWDGFKVGFEVPTAKNLLASGPATPAAAVASAVGEVAGSVVRGTLDRVGCLMRIFAYLLAVVVTLIAFANNATLGIVVLAFHVVMVIRSEQKARERRDSRVIRF